MKGEIVVADKGYISKEFAEEMEVRGIEFVAVKKENMVKSEEEEIKNRFLSRLRKKIETLFSIADNFIEVYKSCEQKRSGC